MLLTCYVLHTRYFHSKDSGGLQFSPTLLPHSLPLSFLLCVQPALPQELLCPDSVKRCCCALNKLKQTRNVRIACFKINPAVYRSLGSTLVGTAWHGLAPTFVPPCRVPLSHNRCLIREDQGGVPTS